jgi:hypothetical protein
LVWRDDKRVARPEKSFDTEMGPGRRPISGKTALPLLKNAYRSTMQPSNERMLHFLTIRRDGRILTLQRFSVWLTHAV